MELLLSRLTKTKSNARVPSLHVRPHISAILRKNVQPERSAGTAFSCARLRSAVGSSCHPDGEAAFFLRSAGRAGSGVGGTRGLIENRFSADGKLFERLQPFRAARGTRFFGGPGALAPT